MARRMYRGLFVGALVGLSLTGIACGGSKQEETSNAPVGKPTEGAPGPVEASSSAALGGATKLGEQNISVQKK
ncbi:MAG: hypothetical protein JWN14_1084 [Chthonomonadales bacterium]|nr:hypothetical protein [Chthonomonadales bacterium]